LLLNLSKFQIGFPDIQYMQITAILSDYDGTLSPITYSNSDNKTGLPTNHDNQIELDRVLWEISRKRAIAIVSTKDFNFLHDRTRFANIISCMMSIETIILKHIDSAACYTNRCVHRSMLNVDSKILSKNSQKLESIIDCISLKFKNVSIYRKLTFKSNLLGGVTIDWRHLDNWNSIKKKIEQAVLRMSNEINDSSKYLLFVQTYSSHPFVDVYSTMCSKEIAYDNICKIINNSNVNRFKNKNILYLGDSENDNPAFRKADVSIGVKSEERLNPKLDCQYLINFSQLPKFLMNLLKNDFNFSEKLV
jgi:hydroxymethylpyrimidine pyrophosphatase-like HAD family hydrolase